MAVDKWYQQAILAALRNISEGRNVIVSSRWFWAQYGFPLPDVRREIVREAKALNVVAERLASREVQGTVAEVMTDAGIPTSDWQGGIGETIEGQAYFKAWITQPGGSKSPRSFSINIPWGTAASQLTSLLLAAVNSQYGESEATEEDIEWESFLLY